MNREHETQASLPDFYRGATHNQDIGYFIGLLLGMRWGR
jgi:hypothetical protein